MENFLDLINQGDACSLSILIAITAFVGGWMTGTDESLRRWGMICAAGTFIVYAIYTAITFRPADAEDWIGVVFRSILAAGLLIGPSWIVLSVLGFGYRHFLEPPLRKLRDMRTSSRYQPAFFGGQPHYGCRKPTFTGEDLVNTLVVDADTTFHAERRCGGSVARHESTWHVFRLARNA